METISIKLPTVGVKLTLNIQFLLPLRAASCSKSININCKSYQMLTANTFRLPLSCWIQSHRPPAPGAYFKCGSKTHILPAREISFTCRTEVDREPAPVHRCLLACETWGFGTFQSAASLMQHEFEERGSGGTHILCIPCLLTRWPATWEQRIRTPMKRGCCPHRIHRLER